MKKTLFIIGGMLCISIISGACSKDEAFNEYENLVDTLIVTDTTINKDTVIKNDTIIQNDTIIDKETIIDKDTIIVNDTIIKPDTIIKADTIFATDTIIIDKNNHLSDLQLADPYILKDGITYYAYGTSRPSVGFEAYKSRNLYEWEYVGFVLNKENTTASKDFWAPEVYKINDEYYMFYAADLKVFVAKSNSPEGPFVQIEKNITNGIDPHLYIEEGRYYLFYTTVKNGNKIWMGELNKNFTLKKETIHLCLETDNTESNINEGPFVIKNNSIYYLTYSAFHFKDKNYCVCVATSDSITGIWVKAHYNPILQKPDNWVGTGHHSLFIDKEGKNRIVFHAHNNSSSISPRRMYIGSYEIDNYGTFRVTDNFIVPKIQTK